MKSALITASLFAALTCSCAFHSSATQWHERMGPNGKPVYIKSTTNVGLNLFILLRLFGGTNIHGMIDEMTEEIAEENGNNVRVIQSSTENYWYGFPPFTWFVTPVITTVAADYEPAPERFAADQAKRQEE